MFVRRIAGAILMGVIGWGGMAMSGSAQTPLSPGSSLPSIESSLKRLDGSSVAPETLFGKKGTVVLFWSNQCPWIDRYEKRVQALVEAVQGQSIRVFRVNANEPSSSSNEALEACRARAEKKGYEAPYLRDPTGNFARALGATQTPQAFVFNQNETLVYVGAIDDNPSGADQVDTPYLRNAIEAVQNSSDVPTAKTNAFGCTLTPPE